MSLKFQKLLQCRKEEVHLYEGDSGSVKIRLFSVMSLIILQQILGQFRSVYNLINLILTILL